MKREGSFRMRREGSQSKIKQCNIHKEVVFLLLATPNFVPWNHVSELQYFSPFRNFSNMLWKRVFYSVMKWSQLDKSKNPSSVTIRREATFHILQCHESQSKNYTIDCFKKSLFWDISFIDLFAFWKYLNFSQLETRGKSSRLWAFGEKNCCSRQMACFISFTVNWIGSCLFYGVLLP